mgnify:FL=1
MKLFSVLQGDLSTCFVTGSTNVAIHHVFPGNGRRKKCERYGFVVALEPRYHNMSNYSVHAVPNEGLDLQLKQLAQKYFEAHYGTRDQFINEFGRSYL